MTDAEVTEIKVREALSAIEKQHRLWTREIIRLNEFCDQVIATLIHTGAEIWTDVLNQMDQDVRSIVREYSRGLSEKDMLGIGRYFIPNAAPQPEHLPIQRKIQAQILRLLEVL